MKQIEPMYLQLKFFTPWDSIAKDKRLVRKTVLFLVLLAVNLVSIACERASKVTIRSEPTPVGSEWHGISLSQPITTKWDVQMIYLKIDTQHEISLKPLGLRLVDGSIITPEIELVRNTGKVDTFRFVGFSGSDVMYENDGISRGTAFSEIRLRSPKPLQCSNIKWISYMPEDTKTGNP
jgi:hypothetical protein